MSAETKELVRVFEQLSEAKRVELVDFARFLLAKIQGAAAQEAVEKWLTSARGAAKGRMSTDEVMGLTRGEP